MISVEEIARQIGAQLLGDGQQKISAPNRIEWVQEGEITFLQHTKYLSSLSECKATAIVTTRDLVDESLPFVWLVVKEPTLSFARVVQIFYPPQQPDFSHHTFFKENTSIIKGEVEIGQGTYIGKDSLIEEKCIIFPQVYIGNRVKIGKNSKVYPGVKIMDDTIIGENCVIHPGAVIGADGFGFVPQEDGTLQKVPQMGNVIIENDVEIGANACIDRAMLGSTIIQKGVKLDNLVQIGHNVQLGQNTVIAAQSGIAGSSQIGKYNQIGGQTGIAPHVKTADKVRINAQSGVSKSITKEGAIMTGTPAVPYMEYNRWQAVIKKIPKEIQLLKDELNVKNPKLR